MVTIDPFDNFLKFSISEIVENKYVKINLNDYTELKMTIKGPKKDLDFKVFRESNQNDFENGVVVIKIPESSHKELKNLSKLNFTLFYINGIDVFGNRVIIYSGFFKMWDSPTNVEILETDFTQANQLASAIITETIQNENEANSVNDALNNNQNINTSTDTSGVPFSEQISNSLTDLSNFRPRYRASDLAISIGISPDVNSKSAYFNLSTSEDSNLIQAIRDANDFGLTSEQIGNPQLYLDLIKAYFKGLDIFPNEPVIGNWNQFANLRDDLKKYILGNTFYTTEIITGEFLPLTEEQKRAFRSSNIPRFISSVKLTNIANTAVAEASSRNLAQQVSSTSLSSQTSQTGNTAPALQIKGIVRDSANDDRGIIGAIVYLSTSLSYNNTQVTDSDGKFNFGNITSIGNPQSIRFEVKAEGYTDLVEDFTLNDLNRNGGELKTAAGDIRPDGLRLEPAPQTTNTQGTSDVSQRIKITVIDKELGENVYGAQITLSMPQRPERVIGPVLTDFSGYVEIDKEDFEPEIQIFVVCNGYTSNTSYITDSQEINDVINIYLNPKTN
jgi:hypothetical protein